MIGHCLGRMESGGTTHKQSIFLDGVQGEGEGRDRRRWGEQSRGLAFAEEGGTELDPYQVVWCGMDPYQVVWYGMDPYEAKPNRSKPHSFIRSSSTLSIHSAWRLLLERQGQQG